jgi:hypothetical protein
VLVEHFGDALLWGQEDGGVPRHAYLALVAVELCCSGPEVALEAERPGKKAGTKP